MRRRITELAGPISGNVASLFLSPFQNATVAELRAHPLSHRLVKRLVKRLRQGRRRGWIRQAFTGLIQPAAQGKIDDDRLRVGHASATKTAIGKRASGSTASGPASPPSARTCAPSTTPPPASRGSPNRSPRPSPPLPSICTSICESVRSSMPSICDSRADSLRSIRLSMPPSRFRARTRSSSSRRRLSSFRRRGATALPRRHRRHRCRMVAHAAQRATGYLGSKGKLNERRPAAGIGDLASRRDAEAGEFQRT